VAKEDGPAAAVHGSPAASLIPLRRKVKHRDDELKGIPGEWRLYAVAKEG